MFDNASLATNAKRDQRREIKTQSTRENFLWTWNDSRAYMCPATRNRRARFQVGNMVSHEIAMRQAVHVNHDEPIEPADVNSAIQNAGLTKTAFCVACMLNSARESRRPHRQDWRIVLAGSIVGEYQFKVAEALYG